MSYKKTTFQHLKLGVLAVLLLNFSSTIFAGEKENAIINIRINCTIRN